MLCRPSDTLSRLFKENFLKLFLSGIVIVGPFLGFIVEDNAVGRVGALVVLKSVCRSHFTNIIATSVIILRKNKMVKKKEISFDKFWRKKRSFTHLPDCRSNDLRWLDWQIVHLTLKAHIFIPVRLEKKIEGEKKSHRKINFSFGSLLRLLEPLG